MTDLKQTFLKQIEAEPENVLHRLIYADWLEEQGDPRAELLRIQEQLRKIDVPDRPQVEARMHELLNQGVQPLTITRTNSVGGELVLIFPGSFRMGSPPDEEDRKDDENQVEVTLSRAFWLGRTVVTQREWQEVMGTTPWSGKEFAKEGESFPATYVSREDAVKFCQKLTVEEHADGILSAQREYTLPTEAQWEYACRAGTTTRFSFGDDESRLEQYAWFRKNTHGIEELYAHEVRQKKANSWGLYDMHGNVWECCRDWYANKLPGGTDPEVLEKGTYRLSRGGCWGHGGRRCRSVDRNWRLSYYHNGSLGFRPTVQQIR